MAIEFLNRYKAAVACMQPYVKGGIYESAKVPGKNQSQACPVCKKDFDHVKDYYNANLRDDRGFWSFENVCIDLQVIVILLPVKFEHALIIFSYRIE